VTDGSLTYGASTTTMLIPGHARTFDIALRRLDSLPCSTVVTLALDSPTI
jgi:hypothetical protein